MSTPRGHSCQARTTEISNENTMAFETRKSTEKIPTTVPNTP